MSYSKTSGNVTKYKAKKAKKFKERKAQIERLKKGENKACHEYAFA